MDVRPNAIRIRLYKEEESEYKGAQSETFATRTKDPSMQPRLSDKKQKTVVDLIVAISTPKFYHIISYHIISYHIISYHCISYHIISYHIISYHIISYHIISYHIIFVVAYRCLYCGLRCHKLTEGNCTFLWLLLLQDVGQPSISGWNGSIDKEREARQKDGSRFWAQCHCLLAGEFKWVPPS